MLVCHFCTPEEDHTGRNVVYILKVLELCKRYLQHVRTTTPYYDLLHVVTTIMPGRKGSTLTYCHWRSSPGVFHCAVVYTHSVTRTHWWVNGEHCLVSTLNKINYSLGLLVGTIESYHNPISPPDDSVSRSTSGGAVECVCWAIEGETSHIRWTYMIIWVKDRNTKTNLGMSVMLHWW